MQLTEQIRTERKVYRLFGQGIKEYNLISEGDKILVGLSGGKDSLALTELLAKRARESKPFIKVEALHVRMQNIDYKSDIGYLQSFAERAGVALHVREGRFDKDTKERRTPCFLCSWNRRKILFETAQDLGCNKIALGHHQDDIIQTALLNQIFEGQFSTMPVLLRMKKFPITIIRPLCKISESDLIKYASFHSFEKLLKSCPYEHDSKRTDIRKLFTTIEHLNPEARFSLWNALKNSGKLVEL